MQLVVKICRDFLSGLGRQSAIYQQLPPMSINVTTINTTIASVPFLIGSNEKMVHV
jgi:hypothetical protein